MALGDDLRAEVATIFTKNWTSRDGTVVPTPESIKLGNDAVKLQGAVLYADLADSTSLVMSQKAHFAAEIYKAYLHCAAKVVKSEGGEITAFDGDRIMAVFTGASKRTSAAKAALKINYARVKIVNPALEKQYGEGIYTVEHGVAVDTSDLFVARIGVRGSNDLVWVGRAANYAAKLATERANPLWITGDVYDKMRPDARISSDGRPIWSPFTWTKMNNMRIFGSTWTWTI